MKKIILIAALIVSLTLLSSCNAPASPSNKVLKGGSSAAVEEIKSKYAEEDLSCAGYDMEKYCTPIWKSDIIYNETITFVKNQDGSFPLRTLAYPIAEVLEVRDSSLKTLYTEGVDYEVVDGKIRPLEGTDMFYFDYDDFYLPNPPASAHVATYKDGVEGAGRYLKVGDGSFYYVRQVCVTYIRTEAIPDTVKLPVFDESKLPNTINKLTNREDITVCYFGDSITTGSSVSGWNTASVEPYMPIYTSLTSKYLKEYYGYNDADCPGKFTEYNTAVGGWTLNNARDLDTLVNKVIGLNPDLIVLAFGMNDSGGAIRDTFKDEFRDNFDEVLKNIRRWLPDSEIILVSTMLPNPNALVGGTTPLLANHAACQYAIDELCEKYDKVVNANVTTFSEWLNTRKLFADISDNYVHPTDFLSRIYTQTILSYLIEDFA